MMSKIKEKFIKDRPHCNIGTIGHVDHGKTTLTAAITKVLSCAEGSTTKYIKYSEIDKHVEERRRGITISAAHVEYQTNYRHYTHIDCPGHQNYIKNMITGAMQMDGAILVVALTEGPQEQTREHIILAKEVGIKDIIVYANKLDALLEPESAEYVELITRELLSDYKFSENAPFIKGSARKALEEPFSEATNMGTGSIIDLLEYIDLIPQPRRPIDGPFLMAIEEVFSISGRGTVVTGNIECGSVKIGDELELVGSKVIKTTCTGLEMYNKSLDVAHAGESVGVLIRGVAKKDVKRGDLLTSPGLCKPVRYFYGKAYFLTEDEGGRKKPIHSGYTPQFFFRTLSITGTMTFEDSMFMPGDTKVFCVKLVNKAPVYKGLHFIMREGTVTLGAGFIINASDIQTSVPDSILEELEELEDLIEEDEGWKKLN